MLAISHFFAGSCSATCTLGAKWILNPYARIMMNYVHTKFSTNINVNDKLNDQEDALTMRAQLDFQLQL